MKRRRNHSTRAFYASVALSLFLATTVRGQSALDGFDPNADGYVDTFVMQPDGKILVGGSFTTVSGVARNHIARLNPDGTLDVTFDPNANNRVDSIAVQADGKILAAGLFTSIGGQTRNHIARLNPDGALDTAFNPNADNEVVSIAVQADGKVLAGGLFTSIGGQTRNRIARLDAMTGLADSFDPNANADVLSIAVQADGKVLAAGFFTSIGGQTRNYIARLDATTGLADSFDPNANGDVFSIAVQADGKILVGGFFTIIGGQPRNHIARLDPVTGSVDSFNPNANSDVLSIAVQADGKILVGGFFDSIGGLQRNNIARLDPVTGSADSFNPNANVDVLSIVVQADGKILVGGFFTTLAPNGGAPVTRNHIARLENDGRLDQTLNLNIEGNGTTCYGGNCVHANAVQADGKILIGGLFTTVLGVPRNNIARLNTDGTLDTAFDPNANGEVKNVAVQADGKILVVGQFTSIGGQTRNLIARLHATTGLADSFDPNASGGLFVDSIAVQADGKILVGGDFTSIGGQTRNYIARLDATTGLADSWDPNPNALVRLVAVLTDGKILVGSDFTSIGGQPRNHIARLDATTGLADSCDPNATGNTGHVFAFGLQADGKILVGGNFTSIGGQTRNFIARLDPTTCLADSFDPNADGTVDSIAVQADGKILAGGDFTSIGGLQRTNIARLNATTGLADSFDPNPDGLFANSITLQADGKIGVGGDFTSIGGQLRSLFARLTNDTPALQNLTATQTTITWTRGGSSQQFTRVTFESSTDNVNYTSLGNGTAAGSDWVLTGLSLPTGQNIYVRARGYYKCGYVNGSESLMESVRYGPAAIPTVLGNISTRLRVETNDNVMIGGFIVTGAQPKRVIVRAIGPSLPVAGALSDPSLELRDSSGALIRSNDNWRTDQEAEIIATGIPPTNDSESALVETLSANGSAYTAIVRGISNGTGVGLVEVYDLNATVGSKLANISTRGLVQTGDDVMIAGTIVLGQAVQRVIVRAIGPSLPVPDALADPTVELRNGNGALIRANDNWRTDQEAEIIATGIPPASDLESAIVETLPANGAAYTAIVRGVNDVTGVALVEIYGLTN